MTVETESGRGGRENLFALRLRTTRDPRGIQERQTGPSANPVSGGFLGSVVPWGADDSLVHNAEVLSMAEVSTHKRHKCAARICTETLSREEKQSQTMMWRETAFTSSKSILQQAAFKIHSNYSILNIRSIYRPSKFKPGMKHGAIIFLKVVSGKKNARH